MALIFKHENLPSIKIVVAIVMLMHFGSQLAFANEDIKFCNKQLQELKRDVHDWNKRCMVKKTQELNTPECNEEKKYNQARMKKHTSQCFYDGNYNLQNLVLSLKDNSTSSNLFFMYTNLNSERN